MLEVIHSSNLRLEVTVFPVASLLVTSNSTAQDQVSVSGVGVQTLHALNGRS